MMNFDAPDRYYCIVSRQKTATPLQSLVLMNDPQYVEAARMLAERTLQEGGATKRDKLNYIFKCLVGRNADAKELAAVTALLEEEIVHFQQNKKSAKALLTAGAHPINPKLVRTELAAYAMVASTIMNFDEFVMKR